MKRKILAILLAVCLLAALVPTTALAGVTSDENILFVGGYHMAPNGDEPAYLRNTGDGGLSAVGADESNYNVKFDGSVLTLRDALITSPDFVPEGAPTEGEGEEEQLDIFSETAGQAANQGILAYGFPGGLTIEVVGTSVVESKEWDDPDAPDVGNTQFDGIAFISADTTIKGDGTLTVLGADTGDYSAGLYGDFSSLTIQGSVTLIAVGGDNTNGGRSAGIYLDDTGTLTVAGAADVCAYGGNSDNASYGIYVQAGHDDPVEGQPVITVSDDASLSAEMNGYCSGAAIEAYLLKLADNAVVTADIEKYVSRLGLGIVLSQSTVIGYAIELEDSSVLITRPYEPENDEIYTTVSGTGTAESPYVTQNAVEQPIGPYTYAYFASSDKTMYVPQLDLTNVSTYINNMNQDNTAGYTWNAATKTLTLKNVVVSGGIPPIPLDFQILCGIALPDGATVVLDGYAITLADAFGMNKLFSAGLFGAGDLTIRDGSAEGTGRLIARSYGAYFESMGIFCTDSTLTVAGGRVSALPGAAYYPNDFGKTKVPSESEPISCTGDLSVTGGKLVAVNGPNADGLAVESGSASVSGGALIAAHFGTLPEAFVDAKRMTPGGFTRRLSASAAAVSV